VVENFSKSSYTAQALDIMVQSYDKLGLTELKNNAQAVIDAN
jgi:outer membrane protein assembly factor BamD